jgi:flagellin
MGFRIATNVQSLSAQRALGEQRAEANKELEKLASGSRIVRAADDAAGLAISEKFRAEIRSTKQANRNAQDAISLIQVAEGGLNEVASILIRMRELSVQSASDTLGEQERQFTDKETQALKAEITRISQTTKFNGNYLLNGEGKPLEFQVGVGAHPERDRIVYDTASVNASSGALGVESISTATKEDAQANLEKLDAAIGLVNSHRAGFGAMQNRMTSTVANLQVSEENMSAANSRIRDADVCFGVG